MRKNDFQKQQSAEMKSELLKHKDKIEQIYKVKLDEEKRRLVKKKVDEMDSIIKENKKLNAKIAAKW